MLQVRHYYGRYLHWSEKRPLLTRCVTSGVLMGLGDFLCQAVEKRKCQSISKVASQLINLICVGYDAAERSFDWGRLRIFSFYGFVVYGPLLQVSFDRVLPWLAPGP